MKRRLDHLPGRQRLRATARLRLRADVGCVWLSRDDDAVRLVLSFEVLELDSILGRLQVLHTLPMQFATVCSDEQATHAAAGKRRRTAFEHLKFVTLNFHLHEICRAGDAHYKVIERDRTDCDYAWPRRPEHGSPSQPAVRDGAALPVAIPASVSGCRSHFSRTACVHSP